MASRNRGKGKKRLRDFAAQWPTDEEVDALRDALGSDDTDPIVCAILGQSFIELELEQLLRLRFRRSDDSTWRSLTSEGGPLSTFSQKIWAGYAFGFYDENFKRSLDVVRGIRNAFAHAKKMIGFDHELVVAEFERLKLNRRNTAMMKRQLAIGGQSAYICLSFTILNALLQKRVLHFRSKHRYWKRRLERY